MDTQGIVDKVVDKDSQGHIKGEVEAIKDGVAKLKADVVEIFSHAFGIGRTASDSAKGSAGDAVENLKSRLSDLKDRGADQYSSFESKIEENPLPAALIAFGVGFVVAKILSRR